MKTYIAIGARLQCCNNIYDEHITFCSSFLTLWHMYINNVNTFIYFLLLVLSPVLCHFEYLYSINYIIIIIIITILYLLHLTP